MLKIVTKGISAIFHPIFAPLISLYILFNFPIYLNYRLPSTYFVYVYLLVFVNLIMAPILISYYLKRKKKIKSLEMESVKERIIPYAVSFVFYALSWFLLDNIRFPYYYLSVFQWAGVTILLLLAFALLNQKTSAHMAAWGGICGMIYTAAQVLEIDSSNILIVAILISGIVGFSRLYLKAHSPEEILSGFLLGLSLQLFVLF